MSRKVPGSNEKMESAGAPIASLTNADLPEDGQSTVIGGDGKARPLGTSDGIVNAPAAYDDTRAQKFVVVSGPKTMSFLDPTSRMRAALRVGKVVDASNYDLEAMKKQGFKLEPESA